MTTTQKLTANQESFAQFIADGKNQSDAYRAAYPNQKSSPKTQSEAASRLMSNSKVLAKVAELKSKLEAKILWKREDSVKALSVIAKEDDLPTAARVSAIKELNAMHGFNEPIKFDLQSKDGTMSPTAIQFIYPEIDDN
jgi:hypothetical protein